LYNAAISKPQKVIKIFEELIPRVGHMQLMRRQIANVLNFTSKLDSNILHYALETMNSSLIADVEAHYSNPETKPYPGEDNPLLSELSKYLETVGINDPFTKIYITTQPIDNFPLLLFIYVISQLPKYQYDNNLNILNRKKDGGDITAMVVGVITLLKQFHSIHTQTFLAYLGQFVRGSVNVALYKDAKVKDYPEEVINVLLFLEDFCKYTATPRKTIEGYLPAYIFDFFTH